MRRAAWARTSCYRSAPAAPAVASTRMRKSARPARRRCTNAAPSTAKHAPIGKACAPCVECRSSTLRATARAPSSGEQAKKRKSENDRSLGISAKLHRLLRSDGGSAFWREEQHRKPTVGLRLDSRRTNQLAPPRHSCLIGRRVRVRYCFIVSRVLAAEVIRFARCLLARALVVARHLVVGRLLACSSSITTAHSPTPPLHLVCRVRPIKKLPERRPADQSVPHTTVQLCRRLSRFDLLLHHCVDYSSSSCSSCS